MECAQKAACHSAMVSRVPNCRLPVGARTLSRKCREAPESRDIQLHEEPWLVADCTHGARRRLEPNPDVWSGYPRIVRPNHTPARPDLQIRQNSLERHLAPLYLFRIFLIRRNECG